MSRRNTLIGVCIVVLLGEVIGFVTLRLGVNPACSAPVRQVAWQYHLGLPLLLLTVPGWIGMVLAAIPTTGQAETIAVWIGFVGGQALGYGLPAWGILGIVKRFREVRRKRCQPGGTPRTE